MSLTSYPLVLFLLCLAFLYFAAQVGDRCRERIGALREEQRADFDVVLGAMLTLLGLLIAFMFSMGVSRYDLRKSYEEAEANAIGTEYLRADLVTEPDASLIRELLRRYLDQRVMFYTTRDRARLDAIAEATSKIERELWVSVRPKPETQVTPVTSLVVSGMNDVLNSEGYTQAAWRNRIPVSAWALMLSIAACCNVLIGYGSRAGGQRILLIVPIAVSIAFFLISDVDSPRGGAIRVAPINLLSVADSVGAPALQVTH